MNVKHFVRRHYSDSVFDDPESYGPAPEILKQRMSDPKFIRAFYPSRTLTKVEVIEIVERVVAGHDFQEQDGQ